MVSLLNSDKEIPIEYVYNMDTRLPNEVFAVELLTHPILLNKDNKGRIEITINRNDVKKALITNTAKRYAREKYIKKREVMVNKDKEIQSFLNGTSNKKQLRIDLDEFPLRWASGGIFSVIKFRGRTWTPFLFRDIPSVGWNISLGHSEREFNDKRQVVCDLNKELNDPSVFIVREFLEETLVLNKNPNHAVNSQLGMKRFCIDSHGIKMSGEKTAMLAKDHIDLRNRYDKISINTSQFVQEISYNTDFDINIDFMPTNTVIHIIQGDRQYKLENVFVCFNLMKLGIEVTKIAKYNLDDQDYMLDGEIQEHNSGLKELIRMPFALIAHNYLLQAFGCKFIMEHTEEYVQPSVLGRCIPEKDIHFFFWDILQRLAIMNGGISGIGDEIKQYSRWYSDFRNNFFDKNDIPTGKDPSFLFTLAAAKIANIYFSNINK